MRAAIFIVLSSATIMVWWKSSFFLMLIGSGDFWDAKNYLQTVVDVKAGLSPYHVPYMQTLGPPLVILPYVVFSYVPVQLGLSLITILSLLSGYVVCWLLVRAFSNGKHLYEKTLGMSLILFSAFPTRFNFITGQLGLMGVLCIVLLMTSQSNRLKGLMFGVLAVLKTFFVFSWISLIPTKRFQLGWAMITLAAALLISLAFFDVEQYGEYRTRFSGVMWQPDKIVDVAYYNQSFKTTLSRMGLVEQSVPIWVFVSAGAAFYLLVSGDVFTSIIFSVVFSPVAWQHYYVVLFPLLVRGFYITKHRGWLFGVWLLSAVLWWIEFPWLHHQSVTWWTGILASHYLLSALLLSFVFMYNHHHET